MRWLRLIPLHRQQKSADDLDAALKSVDSTRAVFDELRAKLQEIQRDVHDTAERATPTPGPAQILKTPAPTRMTTIAGEKIDERTQQPDISQNRGDAGRGDPGRGTPVPDLRRKAGAA